MHLLPILLSSMPGSKHQKKFLTHLMELLPALPGRVNFSDLSPYGGLCARTYARWFARGLEFTHQTLGFLCLAVPADHFLVWAVDGCFLPKSGKHTFGLGRFWNGCQSRVAKGLEQSCLALVDVTEGAAYAVSAQQCPPPDPQAPSCTRTSLVQALGQLREALAVAHRPAVGHVVADGAYSTQTFLQGRGELGLQAIGRRPRNACLRYPYLGPRRRGRGQLAQQAAEVANPPIQDPLSCAPHDVPGDGNSMLAVDHTDHQRHQVILLGGGTRGQHQRILRPLPPARGHPPLQPRGEAALYLQLLARTPRVNAVRIVIPQLPLQTAQRVPVAGTPEAVRQDHGHRILTAVQAQPRALHPQGQHRPQAVGQIRQLRCPQMADVIKCSRSTQGHTWVLWCRYYDPQLTCRSCVRLTHHPASRIPLCRVCAAPPAYIRTGMRFAILLYCCAEYPCQGVEPGHPIPKTLMALWNGATNRQDAVDAAIAVLGIG